MARRKRTASPSTSSSPSSPRSEETEPVTGDDAAVADSETVEVTDSNETADADGAESESFDGYEDEIRPRSRRRSAEDPTPRRRGSERAGRRTREAVPEDAKDSAAAGTVRQRSSAEAERARSGRRRVKAPTPNPAWLAPTAVALLIIGLVYLVTFYLSAGTLPLPIHNWNLLVGFGIMIAGGGLLMRWK